MKGWLYRCFIRQVSVDAERAEIKATEEIRLLNVFCAVLIVWAVVGLVLFFYDERGTFGDMFGSINTLFSGFAFGGIIYTIYQQRAEFRLQREELRLQRDEVAKTNAALDQQVRAANVQRFENTFFNMIQLHNQMVKDMIVVEESNAYYSDLTPATYVPDAEHSGRKAFSYLYNHFNTDYLYRFSSEQFESEDGLELVSIRLKYLDRSYLYFFSKYENMLQPYYKNLLNLLATIDENEWINEKEKKYYVRIVESQLSPDEILIIFYKTLTIKGLELYKLTKKYALIDSLDKNKVEQKIDITLYEYRSKAIS